MHVIPRHAFKPDIETPHADFWAMRSSEFLSGNIDLSAKQRRLTNEDDASYKTDKYQGAGKPCGQGVRLEPPLVRRAIILFVGGLGGFVLCLWSALHFDNWNLYDLHKKRSILGSAVIFVSGVSFVVSGFLYWATFFSWSWGWWL